MPERFRFDRVSQMAATDKDEILWPDPDPGPEMAARGDTEILWPDPDHGPYRIRLEVTELNGRLECTAVEMRTMFTRPITASDLPTLDKILSETEAILAGDAVESLTTLPRVGEGRAPVTASALRSVPLGKLVNEYLKELRAAGPSVASRRVVSGTADDYREAADDLAGRHTESEAEAIQQLASEPRRGGRKGHGDDHYAAVAEFYATAWTDGVHPTEAVAEHWTVAKTTAAKWVSRARELGFLEPTTKGRPGGIPYVEGDTK